MELLVAALILGMAGSLHCVGMCGPIALALPVYKMPFLKKLLSLLTYHSGRIFTYAILGLIFSLLGAGLIIAGYQKLLSVTLGIVLVLLAVLSILPSGKVAVGRYAYFLKIQFRKVLGKRSLLAFFSTGILNGLLPCGMVYVALAGATVSSTVPNGVLFMTLFGLGTIPAMAGITMISTVSSRLRMAFRKASPVITIVMGVLLIVRGLGLGIPMISPEIDKSHQEKQCHQPIHSDTNE
jgi:uncharacterized protein